MKYVFIFYFYLLFMAFARHNAILIVYKNFSINKFISKILSQIMWLCSKPFGVLPLSQSWMNSSMIYLIHYKNFCKYHNVPPSNTTIKKT
jgi:hypothetical protein